MRRLLLLLFPVLLFSCKGRVIDPTVPAGMLYKVTSGSNLEHELEYDDGLLVREHHYAYCQNPIYTVNYGYKSGRLHQTQSVSRMAHSSLGSELCNPRGEVVNILQTLEYDDQGRVSSTHGERSTTIYTYDGSTILMEVKSPSGGTGREYVFKLDNRGNIVEMKSPDIPAPGVTRYEYDDKINPYRQARSYESTGMSVFNSPNNVLKAFNEAGDLLWERQFTYSREGLPLTCVETNGELYEYHYR